MLSGDDTIALDLLCLDISGLKLIKELRYFDSVDSTNDRARALLQSDELKNDALVMAAEQNAGKGRRGRSWISPPGGLWFSLVKSCSASMERLPLVSLASGLAVAEGLDRFLAPGRASLKWPNDVLAADKKLAGILVELYEHKERGRQLIIGIGINVNNDPSGDGALKESATSLCQYAGEKLELEAVLMDVLRAFDKYYEAFLKQQDDVIVEAFRQRCAHLGQEIRLVLADGERTARCLDIAGDGSLLIEGDDGSPVNITAADISLIFNPEVA